ncbi:MAG: DeoR/GlpR family DNA-binding transcription regulator [Lactobacillales bacterium]|jgi:DeoR family lactose phosphotransferase system repressor|nr:DeoR/GlpR family DNA-binding transcription regulator [Lactobacillales bacterium]
MLKAERCSAILDLVEAKGFVTVGEFMQVLNVSDMTIRRDLTELEAQGKLRRVHGGAQSLNSYKQRELSHEEKKVIHTPEKEAVVKKALTLIEDGDTIFLGPGTTIELLAQQLEARELRIITNSLSVFLILQQKTNLQKVYLIGGELRQKTGAFYGEIANSALQKFSYAKAFVSANAIKGNQVMNASIEEGKTQNVALENSQERYLLIDDSKINKEDFFTFYLLEDLTAVITNQGKFHVEKELEQYVKVIV